MDKIENNTSEVYSAEQEIDLVELAQKLWKERKFLFKCCAIAAVVGLIIAFSIPNPDKPEPNRIAILSFFSFRTLAFTS